MAAVVGGKGEGKGGWAVGRLHGSVSEGGEGGVMGRGRGRRGRSGKRGR